MSCQGTPRFGDFHNDQQPEMRVKRNHSHSFLLFISPTLIKLLQVSKLDLAGHHLIPNFTWAGFKRYGDPGEKSAKSCLNSVGFWTTNNYLTSNHPSHRVGLKQHFYNFGRKSISVSVLPMNTQDWSPLGWTGWISLQSKGLSRVLFNTTVQKHKFFSAQLSSQSNSYIHTWLL